MEKMFVGGSYILNCFMLTSLPCFPIFYCSAIPTSPYILKVLYYLYSYTGFRMMWHRVCTVVLGDTTLLILIAIPSTLCWYWPIPIPIPIPLNPSWNPYSQHGMFYKFLQQQHIYISRFKTWSSVFESGFSRLGKQAFRCDRCWGNADTSGHMTM